MKRVRCVPLASANDPAQIIPELAHPRFHSQDGQAHKDQNLARTRIQLDRSGTNVYTAWAIWQPVALAFGLGAHQISARMSPGVTWLTG